MSGKPVATNLLPDEQRTKDTYDDLAEYWVSGHNADGFWSKEMARFHELLPAGAVLEIGVGGARDAKELIALGYTYVGTDVSTGLLEIAKKELPDAEFYEQSVYDLAFSGRGPFDGFWASAVLLHIPKVRIDEALQRIAGVVRQGGVGFISLKDGEGEKLETTKAGGQRHTRFFAYWSKEDFMAVLNRNGFETMDYAYRPMTGKTRWHCFLCRRQRTDEEAREL